MYDGKNLSPDELFKKAQYDKEFLQKVKISPDGEKILALKKDEKSIVEIANEKFKFPQKNKPNKGIKKNDIGGR